MLITKFALIAITAILVENVFLTRALDAGDVTQLLASPRGLIDFGEVFTTMATVCSVLAYYVYQLTKASPYRVYILPVAFMGVVSTVFLLGYYIMLKFFPQLLEKVKNTFAYTSVNCAMLGILFIGTRQSSSVFENIVYGFSAGVGFTLAMAILVVARRRLVYSDVPKVFRGLPILMIYIGLLSLGVFGLLGHRLPS